MAGWTIKCPNCGWLVWRSSIADTLENYYVPARPRIEQSTIACPHCGTQHAYIQLELLYEGSPPL
jgi:predicted RNA-binding Zn-ribbon protein involved in translation (DUF1610 family)